MRLCLIKCAVHTPLSLARRSEHKPAGPTSGPSDWNMTYYGWHEVENGTPKDWQSVIAKEPLDRQVVHKIDFYWDAAAPTARVPADFFAVVATSKCELDSGMYELTSSSDDGMRLFIDDKAVIDEWHPRPATQSSIKLPLNAGEHSFRIEYFENGGGAVLQFAIRRLY